MTDHRSLLEARSDRGTERGANAVWHDATVPAYVALPASRPTTPRWPLAAAAAALVLVAATATVVFARDDRQDSATIQPGEIIPSTIPDPLPTRTEVVMVFFFPDDPAPLAKRYDDLLAFVADADILATQTIDRDESWQEFQKLYGDRPELIEAVTQEILPESIRLLVPEADAGALKARLLSHRPVFQVVLGSERGDGVPMPDEEFDPEYFATTSTSVP